MFGIVKNKLDSILVESFNDKVKFKKIFHESMTALKTNKTSREFFVVYSQLENKKISDPNKAEDYLNETISFLKENKKNLNLTNREKIKALKRLFNEDYKLALMTMKDLYESRKIHKENYLDLYLIDQN